jgi:hypothetical protein
LEREEWSLFLEMLILLWPMLCVRQLMYVAGWGEGREGKGEVKREKGKGKREKGKGKRKGKVKGERERKGKGECRKFPARSEDRGRHPSGQVQDS